MLWVGILGIKKIFGGQETSLNLGSKKVYVLFRMLLFLALKLRELVIQSSHENISKSVLRDRLKCTAGAGPLYCTQWIREQQSTEY